MNTQPTREDLENYYKAISKAEAKDLDPNTLSHSRANRLLEAQLTIARATFTLPNEWTETDSMGQPYTVKANLSQSEDASGTSGLEFDIMENITTSNMVLAGNNLPYLEAVDLANILSSPEGQQRLRDLQEQRKTIGSKGRMRAFRRTPEAQTKNKAKREATKERKAKHTQTAKQRKKAEALAFLASRKLS